MKYLIGTQTPCRINVLKHEPAKFFASFVRYFGNVPDEVESSVVQQVLSLRSLGCFFLKVSHQAREFSVQCMSADALCFKILVEAYEKVCASMQSIYLAIACITESRGCLECAYRCGGLKGTFGASKRSCFQRILCVW